MRYRGLALAAVLLVGGCGGGKDDSASPPETAEAQVPLSAGDASAAPSEAPAEPMGRKVEASTDLYEFSFAYPDAAGAIPGLKELLDGRLARVLRRTP